MICDMCGSEDVQFKAMVEGTQLNVCAQCSKYGKIMGRIATVEVSAQKRDDEDVEEIRSFVPKKTETIQIITQDYAKLVKQAREKKALKQEDVAKILNEKESVIHQVEIGHLKPSLKLARKLEKFYHITLVEQHETSPGSHSKKATGEGLTIGDMIKKR